MPSFDDDNSVSAEGSNRSDSVSAEKPAPAWKPQEDLPPASRTKGLLQVLSAWVLFFNTWGLLNTFGEYQTYYESGQIFHASSSDIAWIGSVQGFLVLLVGLVTGPLYDAGYLRSLLAVGSFLVVFGHMMLSLVNAYWQAVLAQAIVIGIGSGCLFVPSVAVLSSYYSTKLSAAIGIAASGSSLGGIIYPIMVYKLIPMIGFPWTVRVIGFVALALLIIPNAFMRMRGKPPAKRKLVDVSAFKELPFTLFILGGVLGFMGLFVPFYYVSYFGIVKHITDINLSFYLIPILNAFSILGRIIPNIMADKLGPLNVFVPAALMSGVLSFCFIPVNSSAGLVVLVALYGFFSGTFVSLPPSIVVSLTAPEKRRTLGTRVGMGYTVIGLGSLVGSPIAGAILGTGRNLDFNGAWIFGGTTILAGTAIFAASRIAKAGARVERC